MAYWEGLPLGCAGTVEMTGATVAGCTTGGRAAGFGRYSGPVWPQPLRPLRRSASTGINTAANMNGDFTIRITV